MLVGIRTDDLDTEQARRIMLCGSGPGVSCRLDGVDAFDHDRKSESQLFGGERVPGDVSGGPGPVSDTAADVSPKALPFVTAFLDCANYMLFSATQAEKVVMKDAKHGTVYHRATFGSPGRGLEVHSGYCMLKFSIRDDGGVQSNELEAKAEFK